MTNILKQYLCIIFIVCIPFLGKAQITNCTPVITSQSSDATICAGQSHTLQVTASSPNESTLTYVWLKNGEVIPDKTTNQLTFSGFSATDVDVYSVKVKNTCATSTNEVTRSFKLTLKDKPTVSLVANSATVCESSTYTINLNVNENNGGALTYQWKKGSVNISSATTPSLVLNNLQTTDAGQYSVIVSNTCGPTSSANFQLMVSQKPIIASQPVAPEAVCVGQAFTLKTEISGEISGKWQKDGRDIGVTTKTLTINSISVNDAGAYTYVAENTCGVVTTNAVQISVKQKPTISIAGPTSVCDGYNVSLTGSVNGNGDNNISYVWYKNNVALDSRSNVLNINNFKLANAGTYSLEASNICGPASKEFSIQLIAQPTIEKIDDKTACLNETVSIAPSISNVGTGTYTYEWYYNGQPLSTQRTAILTLSNIKASEGGLYYLVVNNGCAPESSPAFNIKVLQLPTITNVSIPAEICAGANLSMSVTSTNGEKFQWYKNDLPIDGATTAQYSFTAQAGDGGQYKVVVSNNCGFSATSLSSFVTVKNAPTIVDYPDDATVCVGLLASATVVANSNGGGTLKYDWSDGNNIIYTSTVNGTFTIPKAALTDAKTYSVMVSNSCKSISGGNFVLTVANKPTVKISTSIEVHPKAQIPTVCVGDPISFNVEDDAKGSAIINYVWFKDDIAKPAQTTKNYSINPSLVTDAGVYKLMVTNSCGSATSSTISIGVHQAPVIVSSPPLTQSACENTALTLTGVAQNRSGTVADIDYSWTLDGNIVPGNSATLTFAKLAVSNSGRYVFNAGNKCGTVSSDVSDLKVVSLPKYSIVSSPNSRSICNSSTPTQTKTLELNVYADNGSTPSITWTTDVGNIIGATNTKTITVGPVGRDATYYAVLTNACGTTEVEEKPSVKGIKMINELSKPSVQEFTTAPLTTFCENDNMTLNVKTRSLGYETFTWKLNQIEKVTNQSGNPNSSDYTKIVNTSDGGTYTVDISNACGTVTDAVSIPVTVYPKPIIEMNLTSGYNDKQCLNGNEYSFTANVLNNAGAISYSWEFGDGSVNTTAMTVAIYRYSVAGSFTARISATNQYGCKGEDTKLITVIGVPKIDKQPENKIVCEGAQATVSAIVDKNGANNVTYQWYKDDNLISGAISEEYKITSMSLSNQGEYYLKVYGGCTGFETISEKVKISFQKQPKASFTLNEQTTEVCLDNASFSFTNKTPVVDGTTFLWTVSDGTTSTNRDLTHTFVNTGMYTVSLKASAGGCSSIAYLNNDQNAQIQVNGLPVITKNLSSLISVTKGAPINLEVDANAVNGKGEQMNVNFNWFKIPATTSYVLNNRTFNVTSDAQLIDSGRYYVNVSNICGTVKSNVITVRVDAAPIITKDPVTTKACIGKPFQLSVEGYSVDNSEPTYQWYFKSEENADPIPVPYPSAKTPVLKIDEFLTTWIGKYYVVLKNAFGETTSVDVLVSEDFVPQINYVESSLNVENGICINSRVLFNASITAAIGGSYTLNWQHNGVTVTGQQSNEYIINSISNIHKGELTLLVTNACGTSTAKMNINVIDLPQFAENPQSVSSCLDGTVTFKSKLADQAVPVQYGYQWLKDGAATNTGIASEDQLTLTSIKVVDQGNYALQTSNICGINTSGSAKLTVISTAPQITQDLSPINDCVGVSRSLNVIATSEGSSLTYAWYKNGNILDNQVNSKIDFNSLKPSDAGGYKVIVSNSCNLSSTSSSQIVVKDKISLTQPLEDRQICAGNALDIDILNNVAGTEPSSSYRWKLNNVDISDPTANTNRIRLSTLSTAQNGVYSITATNSCGSSSISLFTLKVVQVPEIVKQPLALSVCTGSTFTNDVEILNPDQLAISYQWYKDGEMLPNAKTQQLSLQNIENANLGFYSVRVSNICGTIQSNSARLSLVGNPVITQSPSSINACSGTEASSTILATSDDNVLKYAWYKNDVLVGGQTTNKLLFTLLTAGDAGTYKAVVTNGCNLSTTSISAVVYVKEKISLINRLTDAERCVGADFAVDLTNNLNYSDLSSVYQWKLNGVDFVNSTATTKKLVINSLTSANEGQYSMVATNSCGSSNLSILALKLIGSPEITKQPIAASVCAGSDFTNNVEVANPAQTSLSYQWFLDGTLVPNASSQQLSLQNVGSANLGLYAVKVTNLCGTTLSNTARLSLVSNPVITQSPSSINACSGTEASSTILATSDDNVLKYAWYKNDMLIGGQTTNKLLFTLLTASDAGTYKAVVTNGCNLSTTSVSAVVYVKEKISLINRLTDAERCVGADFTVDLTNNLNYSDLSSVYQWKLNGVDFVNSTATTKKLVINSLTAANEGQYNVVATNSCGSSNLSILALKLIGSPEITKQPIAASVCAGSDFTNNVEVANPAQTSLSYQWFLDGTLVPNASSQQLSLQNVGSANLGLYAVKVTNLCGTTQSNTARLSLVGNPVITQNPSDINECSGIDAGTTVVANSNDNLLKYTWYKNDVLLPSQNTNKLSFARLSSTDAGTYKTIVTNSCNLTATSTTIKVLVREKIDLINKIQDAEKCVGSDFTIDVSNNLKNADIDATYQWKINGVDFVNTSATSKKLVINTLTPIRSGQYSLVASNSCGSADITMFKLAVVSLPIISGQPISGEVCERGSWTSSVILANPNQSAVTYQWYKDALALVNGTNADFVLNNVTAVNAGTYYVKISSACGSVISDKVGLVIKSRPKLGINLVNTPPVQCIENNRFDFSADVKINDNTPVDLTWDFGDGVYSKRVSDWHTYKIADNFKVYLYGKAQNGCLDTTSQNITVNTRPSIINDLANQVVCKNAQLNYNIDVKQLPNEVVAYQWYFNQSLLPKETNKTLVINKFVETNKGYYSVRVTNACGSNYSNEVKAELAEKPLLLSSLPIDKKVCEGESIVLNPGVFSLMPVTYQWYKNDLPMPGKELDSLIIRGFSLNDVARYGVRVENICGTTFSANGNLLIKNVPFTPQGVVTDTLCFATARILKIDPIRNNDDTLRISWFLNDKMLQSGTNNQLSLTNFNSFQTGLYKVILSNSCGNVDVPIANLAVNRIKTGFRLDTLDACAEKLKITVTDTSKGFFPITQNYWDIQETGVQLPGRANTSYQFTTPGRFTIRHAVVDERGCISDTIFTTTVNYEKPHAVFSIVNNCLNTSSTPVDSSYFGIGSSKLVKYIWNFGDTIITTNRSIVPSYIYQTPGSKQLKLTVSSDSSCVTDSLVKNFMVYGKPVASFTSQDSCKGFPVLFTNKSTTPFWPDSVNTFTWNFDDGTTSTLKDPIHIFTQYGGHKIRLTAFSANCPNLFDDTVVNLSIKSPRANMTYPRIQGLKSVVGQLMAAPGGRSYIWTPFTGLSDSRIQSPTYKLTDNKVMYTITIVDSAGCVYKDQQEVWAFEKPDIYIASGFSPNNDGINDTYIPEYIQIKYIEYFRIADKNNRQIFITNDMKARWDGTYQGTPLPPDPFVVTVSGIDIYGNRITKQGIVVLVR